MTAEDQQRQQEAQAAQEDQRRGMLVQLLHPAARERRECPVSGRRPPRADTSSR